MADNVEFIMESKMSFDRPKLKDYSLPVGYDYDAEGNAGMRELDLKARYQIMSSLGQSFINRLPHELKRAADLWRYLKEVGGVCTGLCQVHDTGALMC